MLLMQEMALLHSIQQKERMHKDKELENRLTVVLVNKSNNQQY